MSTIKILIVDDSAFMRKVIKDLLESDPLLEVIGTARHGQDCLDKLPQLKPDVVTLDVEMPVLDGLSTLTRIVKEYQLPVIMLSSTTRSDTEQTLMALEHGAFDFTAKPSGSISLDIHKVKDELIEKVKLAYQWHISKQKEPKITRREEASVAPPLSKSFPVFGKRNDSFLTESKKNVFPPLHVSPDSTLAYLVLIGTSTGGPKALQQVLLSLPKLEKAAILIVQHMPPTFTKSLANRLDHITAHKVVEATDGEPIRGGHVYIAPGGYHLHIHQHKSGALNVRLSQDPPLKGHRPSVDTLFESAVDVNCSNIITVLMTGMGRDGTEGLRKLKEKKAVYAIAEHESSCVVYGMPKSAVEAKLIDEIAPLDEIPLVIQRLIKE